MCWYIGFEEFPYWSDKDQSDFLGVVECRRVDDPPPGASFSSWKGFWKMYKTIDRWPF